ncbi:MAG: DegV family protein [Gammaproteobacteria bacterium]
MRIGIVVDSSCDLPRSFIDRFGVEVLPLTLRLGDEVFEDGRDPRATRGFYERFVSNRSIEAESIPFAAPEIRRYILDELVLKYDRLMILTSSSRLSPLFDNATKASFAIVKDLRQRRREAGIEGGFAARVIDTRSAFTGEATIAREAVRLLLENSVPFEKVRPQLARLCPHVRTYVVSRDLYYPYRRGRKHGMRTVGPLGYRLGRYFDVKPVMEFHDGNMHRRATAVGYEAALERVFDIGREAILKGLRTPLVAMSYAGDPADITPLQAYRVFSNYAESHEVELMLAVMSASAGVELGPGAFSLAFVGS